MTTRKRVSVRQMEILVEFLEENTGLARGRLKSKEGNALSSRLWAQCAAMLNAESGGDQRTPKEWNKWFTDYKCRLLSRIRQIKSRQTGTSRGPGDFIAILSPLDERMASLLGADNVVMRRSGPPQYEVQINPLSPQLQSHSPMPTLPAYTSTLPACTSSLPACTSTLPDCTSPLPASDDCLLIHTSPFPTPNVLLDTDVEIINERAEVRNTRPRSPPRRRNRQSSQPLLALERSQNLMLNIEKSRIEVEKTLPAACNNMANAINKMAEAVSKTAESQSRVAEGLEKINKTLQLRKGRRRISSSEEDD